jgi:hypothetical protein
MGRIVVMNQVTLDGVMQGLAVIPGHVVDKDLHRSEASQRSVGSMVVVLLEPRPERQEPLVVRCVGSRVGPLVEHRPVEALRLAVGLGPERPSPEVTSPNLDQRLGERPRHRVVAGVVGHHPLDPHASGGEEGRGLAQERGARRATFVREDRGVGDAAHVVDDLVDVVVATMRARGAMAPATEAVATAVGDAPELLDVHVQQLARALADVPDRDPTRPVAIGQAGQSVADQDIADRRTRRTHERGQAMGPDAELVTGPQDGVDPSLRERARRTVGTRRPILEAGRAFGPVAADPLGYGLTAHPGGFRRPSDRPPVDVDASHQELPTEHGQSRPTMCHESLRFAWVPNTPNRVERLSSVNNVFVNHI